MIDLNKVYREKFGNNDDVKSLGWGSDNSQEVRFKILTEIKGFNQEDSVLDIGCGHGDLSKHVKNYTGVEIRDHAIKIATEKYPQHKFIKGTIYDVKEPSDWIFASGIFCFNQSQWTQYVYQTILQMYGLCNKGIAINFLLNTDQANKDSDMKYVTIGEVETILNHITHSYEYRLDYKPNDVTFYLYK